MHLVCPPAPLGYVAALNALTLNSTPVLLPMVIADKASGCRGAVQGLGGAGAWHRWSEELDFGAMVAYACTPPGLHFPHFLLVLGPSLLTLYKHVLGRRRILTHTHPPVEAACFRFQVAADICFEDPTTQVLNPCWAWICEAPLSAGISAVCNLSISTFYFVYDYMCACAHSVLLMFALSMYDTRCVTVCAHYICIVYVYVYHIKRYVSTRARS